jgi:hypothetical protein
MEMSQLNLLMQAKNKKKESQMIYPKIKTFANNYLGVTIDNQDRV